MTKKIRDEQTEIFEEIVAVCADKEYEVGDVIPALFAVTKALCQIMNIPHEVRWAEGKEFMTMTIGERTGHND